MSIAWWARLALRVGIVTCLLAIPLQPGLPAPDSPTASLLPTPEQLQDRINQRYRKLHDAHCRLQVQLKSRLVPLSLSGDLYYKAPNHVRIVFDNIPEPIKRDASTFERAVPQRNSPQDYVATVTGLEKLNGRPAYRVELASRPHHPNNIERIEVWVDKADLTFPRIVARYKDGTLITLQSEFEDTHGLRLPRHSDVKFRFPRFSLSASGDFLDYEIDKGIPDDIFK